MQPERKSAHRDGELDVCRKGTRWGTLLSPGAGLAGCRQSLVHMESIRPAYDDLVGSVSNLAPGYSKTIQSD